MEGYGAYRKKYQPGFGEGLSEYPTSTYLSTPLGTDLPLRKLYAGISIS